MSELALTIGSHLVLPAALLWWLGWSRPGSRLAWALQSLSALLALLLLALAGTWILLPWYSGVFWLLVGLILTWRRGRQMGDLPGLGNFSPGSLLLTLGLPAALSLILIYQLMGVAAAWRPGDDVYVDLGFPLSEGTYYVAHGGSDPILNAHLRVLDRFTERAAGYRGQAHAVDIIALTRWGSPLRSWRLFNPESYRIFGTRVLAPCAGEVVQMRHDLADLPVPKREPDILEGNHVLLDCGSFQLLLAHLRQGSVVVRPGDLVRVGDTLGEVGNSGNTSQPHLHIHAQRPGPADRPFSGEPLKMRIEGTFLVRNMTISGGDSID